MTRLRTTRNGSVLLVLLVSGVAAFAAFRAPARADVVQPAPAAPAPQFDPSPPSWAIAAPVADDDLGAALQDGAAEPAIVGKVLEQLDVAKYSYLRLATPEGSEVWTAVPITASRLGETVTVESPERMTQFNSASLGRTFELIFFGVLDAPAVSDAAPLGALAPTRDPHEDRTSPHPGPDRQADAVPVEKCEKAAGPLGRTVAELNALDPSASGSKVRLRATVVRATSGVMGRTFLHLRDGTGVAPLTHDLTATTTEEFSVGSLVLLEGVAEVDKDFGSGYRYRVLLVDARRLQP